MKLLLLTILKFCYQTRKFYLILLADESKAGFNFTLQLSCYAISAICVEIKKQKRTSLPLMSPRDEALRLRLTRTGVLARVRPTRAISVDGRAKGHDVIQRQCFLILTMHS